MDLKGKVNYGGLYEGDVLKSDQGREVSRKGRNQRKVIKLREGKGINENGHERERCRRKGNRYIS